RHDSRVAHVQARICCSARENGRHSEKEPHGRCRGEGCAQEQQQIGAPGRLRLCGLGGTIEFIDLVRIDQLHRICIGSLRGVCGRPASAGALGIWDNRKAVAPPKKPVPKKKKPAEATGGDAAGRAPSPPAETAPSATNYPWPAR